MAVDQKMAARLIEARELTYDTAAEAVDAHGFVYSTYLNHEGGHRGFTRHVPHYAKAYKVIANWLLTGNGVPRLRGEPPPEPDEFPGLTPEEKAVILLLRSQKGNNS